MKPLVPPLQFYLELDTSPPLGQEPPPTSLQTQKKIEATSPLSCKSPLNHQDPPAPAKMSSVDFVLAAFKLLSQADRQTALLQMMSEMTGLAAPAASAGKTPKKTGPPKGVTPPQTAAWSNQVHEVLADMVANGWEEHSTKGTTKNPSKVLAASEYRECTAEKKTATRAKGEVYEAHVFADSGREPTYKDAMSYASWLRENGRLAKVSSTPASTASSVKSTGGAGSPPTRKIQGSSPPPPPPASEEAEEEAPARVMKRFPHKGKTYLKDADGYCWVAGPDGALGDYAGKYDPTSKTIDASAEEPSE